jgi:SOS-response transcriptional repressor LexA
MSRLTNFDLAREIKRKVKDRPRYVQQSVADPTLRQMDVLTFMRAYLLKYGFPPTLREIGESLGIASPNGVMCHIRGLRKKGLVHKVGYGMSRTWMPIVEKGCCPACARQLDI